MKQTIQVQGGSSLGHIMERLYAAGARPINPGQAEKVGPFSFAITVDWPDWREQAVREVLKGLVQEYGVKLA